MKKILFSVLFFLILLEIGLRLSGVFLVYSEKVGGHYRSYWGFEHEGYYKLHPQNEQLTIEQKEFKVTYYTNSYGFRNPEITPLPKDSIIRILCLGDSFTEGAGATHGNSFPRHLERYLNEGLEERRFEVVNIGNSGSDIIYCEKLFMDLAYRLKPQIVLFVTSDSDVQDIIQRGGNERFQENFTTKYKNAPWFEKYYARSHIVRLIAHKIFNVRPILLTDAVYSREVEKANFIIDASMKRVKEFSDSLKIQVRFIIHPFPSVGYFEEPFEPIDFSLEKDDLTQMKEIEDKEKQKYIYYLNQSLIDTLRTLPFDSIAWRIDGHFNDKGYKIMAEQIYYEMLQDSLLLLR